MSKFSNLYDIDGNIINKSPQHTYTLEECEKLVDDLTKKVEENPDNEVYRVYLNNAQKWLMHMYDGMSRQDLMKRMSFLTDSIQNAKDTANEAEQKQIEKISKAMEELKESYDKEDPLTGAVIPDDMMEDIHKGIRETVMDEYVEPIEEIKNDETDKEDIRPLHSGEPKADETGSTE